MDQTQSQQFNTALLYGYSGVGKTSQIGPLALYILRKYGKTTRYITADGGGWRPLQPYIDAGIIEPLSLLEVENPFVRLRDITEGYWPQPNGKWVQDRNGFDKTGMYVLESLSSIADIIMAYLVNTEQKISSELAVKIKMFAPETDKSGKQRSYTFGNASVSHYGFVQQEIGNMIRNMQALLSEGLKQIVYGSLVASGDDDRGVRVLGPEVKGKAMTAVIPARVGDMVYIEVVHVPAVVGEKGKGGSEARNEHRAYITNRRDKVLEKPYPAKFRLSLQEQDAIRKPDCGVDIQWEGSEGYIVLDPEDGNVEVKGIARLWEWRDNQGSKVVDGLRELLSKYQHSGEAAQATTETQDAIATEREVTQYANK